MHTYFWDVLKNAAELSLFFIGLYYALAGVFSFFRKYERPTGESTEHSFAVIIPAHNEGAVIAQLLQSVAKCNYSSDLIDVYVAADNCDDNTVFTAKKLGASVVVRNDGEPNKSSAIMTAQKYIKETMRRDYDCFVFLDADNTVSTSFFYEINHMLCCGHGVVQGRVECKNPNRSWFTAAESVWNSIEIRFGRLAPYKLGLGSKICGTGYAVRSDILDRYPLCTDCLAEDIEYTMRLAVHGIKTAFADNAVVYDEKPESLRVSMRQRLRWVQGIVDVQGRYGTLLLKKGKLLTWLSLYGDFLGVFTYGFFCVVSLFSTISIIYDMSFAFCEFWVKPIAYIMLNIYLGIGAFSAFFGLLSEKKLNRSVIFNLFGLLVYFLTWIPVGIVGIFRHNRKEWYHTKHTGCSG